MRKGGARTSCPSCRSCISCTSCISCGWLLVHTKCSVWVRSRVRAFFPVTTAVRTAVLLAVLLALFLTLLLALLLLVVLLRGLLQLHPQRSGGSFGSMNFYHPSARKPTAPTALPSLLRGQGSSPTPYPVSFLLPRNRGGSAPYPTPTPEMITSPVFLLWNSSLD